MFAKAVRFYKWGGYVLVLFSLLHLSSFLSDPSQSLTGAEDLRVWELMRSHVFHVGGISRTVFELLQGFSLYLTIFTLGLGVQSIFIAKHGNPDLLKKMAGLNVIVLSLLLVVTAIFFHLVPLLLFALAAISFLLAYFKAIPPTSTNTTKSA